MDAATAGAMVMVSISSGGEDSGAQLPVATVGDALRITNTAATEVDEGLFGSQGGRMGTFQEGELVGDLDKAAFALQQGERKLPEQTELRPLSFERAWGPFERRFALPPGCYPDRVNAKYADGVLEVRVAMEPSSPPVETKIEA